MPIVLCFCILIAISSLVPTPSVEEIKSGSFNDNFDKSKIPPKPPSDAFAPDVFVFLAKGLIASMN